MTEPIPLRCPYCNSELEFVLEYTGYGYSEHRDLTGIECDNWNCAAEWAPSGDSRWLPKDPETGERTRVDIS